MPAEATITFTVLEPAAVVENILHNLPANVSGDIGDVFTTSLTAIDASGDPIEADYTVSVDNPSVVTASITEAVLEVRMIDVGVGAVIVKSSARLGGGGAISTGAPAYDPGAHTLVYQDDMSKYTDWDDMGNVDREETAFAPAPSILYYGGQPTPPGYEDDKYDFITGRGGSGQALRVYRDGSVTPQDHWGLYLYRVPSQPRLAHHYIQYWCKQTWANGVGQALDYKWFLLWHASPYTGSRTQWHTHAPYTSGCGFSTQVHSPVWAGMNAIDDHACRMPQARGPYLQDLWDGASPDWHKFTYEFKAQDDWGTDDGIVRMWIDDIKVMDVSTAAVDIWPDEDGEHEYCLESQLANVCTRGPNFFDSPAVRTLEWLSNQSNYPCGAYTFDIDDFIWWTDP